MSRNYRQSFEVFLKASGFKEMNTGVWDGKNKDVQYQVTLKEHNFEVKITDQALKNRFVRGCPYSRWKSRVEKMKWAVNNVESGISVNKTTLSDMDINKKFDFMERLVTMVAKKQTPSCVITGEGGLGKTYSVQQVLKREGLEEDDYVRISGYSTAKGLFITLYENREKLIVFDDCDKVLTDEVARNILKGALDSYEKRVVHWITSIPNPDLPSHFEFKGSVIFISNLSQARIDQSLISRSMTIDLTMSIQEKLERMENLLPNLCPEVPMERRKACLNLIKHLVPGIKDLNMRTLLKAIKLSNNGEDWQELVEYMLLS